MQSVDLRISISYLTEGEVGRIGSPLKSNPSDAASGWYVRAYTNEGYDDIIKYARIPPQTVLTIADAIDDALSPDDAPLWRAVKATQTEIDKRHAERITALRKRIESDQALLAALTEPENPVVSTVSNPT